MNMKVKPWYERLIYNNPSDKPIREGFWRPYRVPRRPDGLFYYIWNLSDLFCKETDSEPPNFPIKLDLTACGRTNIGMYLGNITFINVDVIE